jgi:ubiquinone/menaquinone biosynthesis C-methylase UbiE
MFTHEDARRFYDRFGRKQDWQRFYESSALRELLAHGSFASAEGVLEFGCGTGHLARTLLERHLPSSARYLGVDVSSTMVSLARRRLEPFGDRARVALSTGEPRLDAGSATFDRFVSTYVLDLLDAAEITAVLAEAHRVLVPGGVLALASLTHGFTFASRLVERAWSAVHARSPSAVGGCRPISLRDLVTPPSWSLRHWARVSGFGVPSEIVVAERAGVQPVR